MTRRASGTALAVVLLAALVLRWPIASHDVEHYAGPDEGEVVENVLEMMKTGDYDHRHPGYPGLHFYLQLVPATAHLVAARALGEGDSIPELPRSGFYLGARRLTLLFGLLTVPVLFWCGLRFLEPWAAALGAALLALSPLAFRESAVVSPDLALGLFVTAALGLALRLLDVRTTASFLAAGAAFGLAAAVKYTGALAVVPYALAWLLGRDALKHAWRAVAGGLAAGAAFAVTSPYTLLKLDVFFGGLATHASYYAAADMNAAWEVLRAVVPRGLGVVGSLAALVGALGAVRLLEPKRLVLLGYPAAYLLVFAFFDRAYPRHALPLLPHLALLAADMAGRLTRVPRFPASRVALAGATGVGFLLGPFLASLELARRAARPTPAERAAAWLEAELPAGSRMILEDQYTPRLDPDLFHVRRLGVEEKVFAGNYDWVLYSGYPPGLPTEGLREVRRFEREDALGDAVVVYQVPDRAGLMGVTLADSDRAADLGAGELVFFGEGWYEPAPGAFGTSRLSRGPSSEIFFVLESEARSLDAELLAASAVAGRSTSVEVELNGKIVGELELETTEPETRSFALPSESLRRGLNRLVLRYRETARLNRRRRDTAMRFYRLTLTRTESPR